MRKASLDLSVNSIIVFVLAFAMLGVGLYFTNIIKDRISKGTEAMIDFNKLENPPDAQNPITIPSDVSIKRKKELKIQVGFYNKANAPAVDATLTITSCIDDDRQPVTTLPKTSAATTTVDSATGAGYSVKIVELGLNQGSYICTMSAHKAGDPTVIYESKQFFFTVTS